MVFCFRAIYFLVLAHTASSELILKIDLNERTDRRTTVNYLNITFVNTTDSPRMLHYDKNITLNINEDTKKNVYGIHQLVKRNPEFNPMYVSFHFPPIITTNNNNPPITTTSFDNKPPITRTTDDNIPTLTHIPLIHLKSDSSIIKKCLDDFKMSKRRTYVSTPDFNFPFKRINSLETGFKQDNYRRKDITNQIAREAEIFDLISKQNELIERIANKVLDTERRKKKIVRTVFDDILESVEDRYNKTTPAANVTTTTEHNLPTVLTLIDETEIRKALKKNPFVNRILRMAEKKKKEYLEKRKT